ncbi:HlyD family type I secretion periplasmic adaptor subunit [Shinella zoogloeoides]|uniref:Membrane fusion protein (MFP) family protein n=1 Tax=Shinella zoogloeoides TaxID=352475 RepID=A0A6N8TJ67_SHIZO|nr:HlyD family type I secretion periplasmic adaptor subunit [Shinella zoogloeoides]MXO02711.1 HlyD family type I secretion periplasmic adaptor subunit [Shinella zoogloeoides]UEX81837.1 HlyD family type I secretion periplasmic adaptor subunit [Shinella zoogloeoides]
MADTMPAVGGGRTITVAEEPISPRGPITAGILIVVLFFGLFGGWAVFAPLNGAIIGDGTVTVEGNRRKVDHYEGGVVEQVKVRDGSFVTAGQVLIALDDTKLLAQTEIYGQQLAVARATEARLIAEATGAAAIEFPAVLRDGLLPYAAEAIASQREEFNVRREALEGERGVLRSQIEDLEKQMAGRELQITLLRLQIESFASELEGLDQLLSQGLATRERTLALQRNKTALEAQIAGHEADMASLNTKIAQSRQRVSQISLDRRSEVTRELADVRQKILDIVPVLDVAKQGLARSLIVAPIEGRIVNLATFSPGEVIAPGETVLEIVPDQAPLVVSAKFKLEDISELEVGSAAEVRFSTLTELYAPSVKGRITTVSADQVVDDRSGSRYYIAQVAVNSEDISRVGKIEMYPGMPATVLVTTRNRTALEYLLSPLLSTLDMSFRQG